MNPGCAFLLVLLFVFHAVGESLAVPERPADAPAATALIERLSAMSLEEREQAIVAEVKRGNVPVFLRTFVPVPVAGTVDHREVRGSISVLPDYLAVGSDEDYLLAPLTPLAAQRLADDLGCLLPTQKIVDQIYSAAALKMEPSPIPPSPAMTTMPIFAEHNAKVQTQRSGALAEHPTGVLVAGHKKDVVITSDLFETPDRVAIYGWHRRDGKPIQPLYTGHGQSWVDYSHGIRLVSQRMVIDGAARRTAEILADPDLSVALSDDGPIAQPRYVALSDRNPFTGFQSVAQYDEQALTFRLDPGVRVHMIAPATFSPRKSTQLIIYALPNGNTLEETLGRAVPPGDKSKYGIQQIAAQTRFLREKLKDRNVVVACIEASGLAWPAWRKKHGDQHCVAIVDKIAARFAGLPLRITLSGHSGGGSFIFGYINAHAQIPDQIERIAFLDANYAYETERHATKLTAWIKASRRHYLCVLAYRDHVARWEGKPFVSEGGGTGGRSRLMMTDLDAQFSLWRFDRGDFKVGKGASGRIQILIHENPEAKILHTVQVERNGFIHSMLSGTKQEERGYDYFGAPVYTKWIEGVAPAGE
jgi:hypothetical protein